MYNFFLINEMNPLLMGGGEQKKPYRPSGLHGFIVNGRGVSGITIG